MEYPGSPRADGAKSSAISDETPKELVAELVEAQDKWAWQTPTQRRIRICLANTIFEHMMALIIVGNFFLTIVETDYQASEDTDSTPSWISASSWVILIIFVVETAMRIFSEEMGFFKEEWNVFDFAVIASDLVCSLVSLTLGSALPISVLRVARLGKVARVSKIFRFFPELRLMMVGLVGAFRAMLWGTVLLFIALLVLSIVAVQLIHPLNREVEKTGVYGDCDRCGKAFSTVMAATLTFSQQILAGDSWGLVSIPIIETYPVTAIFFGATYLIIGVAILNLILGVVVDVAQQARKKFELELEFHNLLKQREKQSHLLKVCYDMDDDKSGYLTKQELFDGYEHSPAFRKTLTELGVEKEDMEIVWLCLDSDKSGSVSYTEFVSQLYSMKSSDLLFMTAYIKYYVTLIKHEIFNGLEAMTKDIDKRLTNVDLQVNSMQQSGKQDGEKLDLLLNGNSQFLGEQKLISSGNANGTKSLYPTLASPIEDVMEEIRKNHGELTKRFADMEMSVGASRRSYTKPSGAALSLWHVPGVCQNVVTARNETVDGGSLTENSGLISKNSRH